MANACQNLGVLKINGDVDTCQAVLDGLLKATPRRSVPEGWPEPFSLCVPSR